MIKVFKLLANFDIMDAQFIFRREELEPRSIMGFNVREYVMMPEIKKLGLKPHCKKTYELGNDYNITTEWFFGSAGDIMLDYVAHKSNDFIVNMHDFDESVCKELLAILEKESKGAYIDSVIGMGFGLHDNI